MLPTQQRRLRVRGQSRVVDGVLCRHSSSCCCRRSSSGYACEARARCLTFPLVAFTQVRASYTAAAVRAHRVSRPAYRRPARGGAARRRSARRAAPGACASAAGVLLGLAHTPSSLRARTSFSSLTHAACARYTGRGCCAWPVRLVDGGSDEPHESHVPYVLQFMVDHGVYGMGCGSGRRRAVSDDTMPGHLVVRVLPRGCSFISVTTRSLPTNARTGTSISATPAFDRRCRRRRPPPRGPPSLMGRAPLLLQALALRVLYPMITRRCLEQGAAARNRRHRCRWPHRL